MTDSQQNQQSSHLGVLEEALHPRVVAALDGRIREVANEEIDRRMGELTATVNDLADQQRAQIAAFKDLTPQQQREVVDDVNDSTAATRRAVQGQNDLAERQRSGEEVSSEELEQVEADTADAEQQQAATERKLAAATRAREEHEAQQAERTDRPKSEPAPAPSRDTSKDKKQDKGDGNYVTQTQFAGLVARVDQIDSRSKQALAIAKKAIGSESQVKRGSTWAIGVFVTVALVYLVIWGLSPGLEHTWWNQFAWPIGFGAVAFWLGAFTAHTSKNDEDEDRGQYSEEDEHGHRPIWEGDRDHGHSDRTDTRAHA